MNSSSKIASHAALTAMMAFVAGTAHAQAAYVGLSRTTPGEFYADFADAKHVQNQSDPLALKFYDGAA